MESLVSVTGSIEFRDAAMRLHHEGRAVYATLGNRRTYRILVGTGVSITLDDLFEAAHPPVQMEDFATALVRAESVPIVDVFTL